ncbi:hypothetical protein CN330_23820 [Priestia megaterium]|uniref:hypothetical protein n=1 Tax=Priestia megaterium TaxID=1404 RepID=UPI000BF7782D|nr:hypothetical protein [Priestia megaterium]PEZ08791.1 hypothetical protein CN330_23820 [Priestia megaterium]
MGKSKRQTFIFISATIAIALIVIPMAFNFLFLWDSGLSKGKTDDWFTMYGSIFGGLIGGFFTYIALVYTLKHDKDKLEKEKDFLIKDAILTSREYIDSIQKKVIEIAEEFTEKDRELMDNQYKINSQNSQWADVFKGEALVIKDLDSYVGKVKSLNNTITEFKNDLKSKYIELKDIDDEKLQNFLFDSYLALAHYERYIEGVLEDDRISTKQFIYQFANGDYYVGFRGIVHVMRDEINDNLYPKYIKKDRDQVGDIMRNVSLFHIRG